MKSIILQLFILSFVFCVTTSCNKHLNEKIFHGSDYSVKWYRISAISSVHDYVDLEKWGHTKTILEANTNVVYDILIKEDTITIQIQKGLPVYELSARTLNCYIKLDTSVMPSQYMQKYAPENAQYYRENDAIQSKK